MTEDNNLYKIDETRFIRKTVQFNFDMVRDKNGKENIYVTVQPYGISSTEEFLELVKYIFNKFDATAYISDVALHKEEFDERLKRMARSYQKREDKLKDMMDKSDKTGLRQLVEVWINKCMDCRFGKNCLYLLCESIMNEMPSREKVDAYYTFIDSMPREKLLSFIDDIIEASGVTDESFVKALNDSYDYCRKEYECVKIKDIKKPVDVNEQIFGICSDCPQRMFAFQRMILNLIGLPHDVLNQALTDIYEELPSNPGKMGFDELVEKYVGEIILN